MKQLLAALVVVTAIGISGVGVAAGAPPAPTESVSQNALALQLDVLDGLQNLIERIDKFLESVVDLMKTLNELFGGGEGGD